MKINNKWILTKSMVVLFFLLSPVIESLMINGVDRYKFHPQKVRQLDYIGESIYTDKPPIDFLFIGPSSLWASIHARLIQDELRNLNPGKNISVENFGHQNTGNDLDYIILKDLVENRGVKRVFLGLPAFFQNQPHREMRYLWDPIDHFSSQNFGDYLKIYSEKILDSIPNIIRKIISPPIFHPGALPFIRSLNGSVVHNRDFMNGRDHVKYRELPIFPIQLRLKDILKAPGDSSLNVIKTKFGYQEHFITKIVQLLQEHKVELYFFLPSVAIPDFNEERMKAIAFNHDELGKVNYLGIHPRLMPQYKDQEEIKKYYFDNTHTNRNGSEYFSRLLIGPLQEIYENKAH